MTQKEILSKVDHTLLKVGATFEDVKKLIDEAIEYGAYSVCISPCYVEQAKDYADGRIKICTVIGFPSGNVMPQVKLFEAVGAISDGVDEIDMVINVGHVKAGKFKEIELEILAISNVCKQNEVVLKVIIETCLLTDNEIIKMCQVVKDANADYIKTSTGFSTSGATFEVVELMKKTIDELGGGLKIKAAGGIKDFDDAQKFIELGADRLGTSRLIGLMK